jgi:hypothetical protein
MKIYERNKLSMTRFFYLFHDNSFALSVEKLSKFSTNLPVSFQI